jgi:hypothetical protein
VKWSRVPAGTDEFFGRVSVRFANRDLTAAVEELMREQSRQSGSCFSIPRVDVDAAAQDVAAGAEARLVEYTFVRVGGLDGCGLVLLALSSAERRRP